MKDKTEFEIDYYNASLNRVIFKNNILSFYYLLVRVLKFWLHGTFLKSIKTLVRYLGGTFLCSWKMAEVSPILKDGDFEEPYDYRPISLLPIVTDM